MHNFKVFTNTLTVSSSMCSLRRIRHSSIYHQPECCCFAKAGRRTLKALIYQEWAERCCNNVFSSVDLVFNQSIFSLLSRSVHCNIVSFRLTVIICPQNPSCIIVTRHKCRRMKITHPKGTKNLRAPDEK